MEENEDHKLLNDTCHVYGRMQVVAAELKDDLSPTDQRILDEIFRRAIKKLSKRHPALWRLPSQWHLGEEASHD
jgi:hypothetical protein